MESYAMYEDENGNSYSPYEENDYSYKPGIIAVGNNVELVTESIKEAGGFANILRERMEKLADALIAFMEEEKRKERFVNKFRMYFVR